MTVAGSSSSPHQRRYLQRKNGDEQHGIQVDGHVERRALVECYAACAAQHPINTSFEACSMATWELALRLHSVHFNLKRPRIYFKSSVLWS